MITIFLMNFGYSLETTYLNLQEAVAAAKKAGFECAFALILGSAIRSTMVNLSYTIRSPA